MIDLPIGLRAKLYIKPVATIAMVLTMLGLSVMGFLGKKEAAEFKKKSFKDHNLYNLAFLAINKGCKGSFNEVVCTFFEGYVKSDDLVQPELLNEKIERFEAFDRSTKEQLKDYIQNLPLKLAEQNKKLGYQKTFREYSAAAATVHKEIVTYENAHNLLARENLSWKTVALAQWMHQNWWTLVANLLILGLFGMHLEQRIGRTFLLMVFVLGGSAGMTLQAAFASPYEWVAGGTSGVMAILGAYSFFFLKQKMQISLNKITIPGWAYIFLFLVGGNAFYIESNIVLYSHSAGVALGVFSAVIISMIFWVQKDFLFEAEQVAFYKAKKTASPTKKITHVFNLLEINPYQFQSVEYLIKSVAKHHIEPFSIPNHELKKIGQLIVRMINGEFNVMPTQGYAIISLLPLTWNFTLVPMPMLTKRELNKIENQILESDWRLAIRFYDLYLTQHPNPKVKEAILLTVRKIIVNAESPVNPEYHQNIEWLRLYVLFSGTTAITQFLADKYEDKTAAS